MSAGPLLPQIERIWHLEPTVMRACYVCGSSPDDTCRAVDGQIVECPRSIVQLSAEQMARIWDAALNAPEPTEAELDAERAAEDEHGWRDRDWT